MEEQVRTRTDNVAWQLLSSGLIHASARRSMCMASAFLFPFFYYVIKKILSYFQSKTMRVRVEHDSMRTNTIELHLIDGRLVHSPHCCIVSIYNFFCYSYLEAMTVVRD